MWSVLVNPATLRALKEFPLQLETHFAAFPAGLTRWVPPSWEGIPSERYTAIEQLCHVLDIEVDGYQIRLRRAMEEEHPFLPSIDGDALAVQRAYTGADPRDVLLRFRKARVATVEFIEQLSADQLQRTAEFEGYGAVTVRSLVHYLCSHDQQHLAGLQWLLGQIEARSARE